MHTNKVSNESNSLHSCVEIPIKLVGTILVLDLINYNTDVPHNFSVLCILRHFVLSCSLSAGGLQPPDTMPCSWAVVTVVQPHIEVMLTVVPGVFIRCLNEASQHVLKPIYNSDELSDCRAVNCPGPIRCIVSCFK